MGVTTDSRHRPRHRVDYPGGLPDHAPYVPVEPPVRGEAIQALTRDVLIHRSLEVSPSGFITIVSIIQGVALALLAQNMFDRLSVLVVAQGVALLSVLIAVFYTYMTISILLRWAPSIVDCFLPFAVAGLEIPPAFFLGDAGAWNAWLAAFWFCTGAGLWITEKWSPQSHFGTAVEAHRTLHKMLRELRLTAGVGGLAGSLFALLAFTYPAYSAWWGVAGALGVLAAVGMVVARTELRASQIHAYYGVSRPPFN